MVGDVVVIIVRQRLFAGIPRGRIAPNQHNQPIARKLMPFVSKHLEMASRFAITIISIIVLLCFASLGAADEAKDALESGDNILPHRFLMTCSTEFYYISLRSSTEQALLIVCN